MDFTERNFGKKARLNALILFSSLLISFLLFIILFMKHETLPFLYLIIISLSIWGLVYFFLFLFFIVYKINRKVLAIFESWS